MNILYVGDVMGEPGLKVVEQVLPDLKKEKQVDFVIAQAENVSDGKGTTVKDYRRLLKSGVDFCSGGNWSMKQPEIADCLSNPNEPIIRPANWLEGSAGLGWKYGQSPKGKVLVISLQGQVVGRDANLEMQNPLKVVDKILQSQKDVDKVATVVNFHGDFSSEKMIIGHYLDGCVTAVIGDHWHIPTADAGVLPKGTAHITDVGMCGALDSSLGLQLEPLIRRWRDGEQNRNELETSGRMQFNALLIKTTNRSLASSTEFIQRTFDNNS